MSQTTSDSRREELGGAGSWSEWSAISAGDLGMFASTTDTARNRFNADRTDPKVAAARDRKAAGKRALMLRATAIGEQEAGALSARIVQAWNGAGTSTRHLLNLPTHWTLHYDAVEGVYIEARDDSGSLQGQMLVSETRRAYKGQGLGWTRARDLSRMPERQWRQALYAEAVDVLARLVRNPIVKRQGDRKP